MSASISIFLRAERMKSNGEIPMYLRFTLNRKKVDISLKKYVSPKTSIPIQKLEKLKPSERLEYYGWNAEKEQLTKGADNYDKINYFITKEKKRAVDIILKYQLHDKHITKELFKKEFSNSKGINISAHEYFIQELEKRKNNYSAETLRSYKSILSKLKEYKPQLELKDIDNSFLINYEHYMLQTVENGGKGNTKRTVANNMKIIKTFINMAINNGDLPKAVNPFDNYKIKKYNGVSNRAFLEPDELEKLEELLTNYLPLDVPIESLSPEQWKKRELAQQLTPAEYNVLRYFLFACYTGLRFQDIKDLNYCHIKSRLVQQNETSKFINKYYIELDMHKTGFTVKIPLMEKAIKLINLKKEDGKVFRVISNQKTNRHIKRIIALSEIKKKITFHCSRHTFASVALMYDLPQKFIQSILGHQNSNTTEIYSHVVDDYLFNHIDDLSDKLKQKEKVTAKELPKPKTTNSDLLNRLVALDATKLEKLIALAEVIS
jgi:integrase/recombinase XerC